jgi:hypothetical protein
MRSADDPAGHWLAGQTRDGIPIRDRVSGLLSGSPQESYDLVDAVRAQVTMIANETELLPDGVSLELLRADAITAAKQAVDSATARAQATRSDDLSRRRPMPG